jgi:hypothetical protein
MNPQNDAIRNGLNRALGVLFRLNDEGFRVLGVEVSGRNPIVRVDGDPQRKLASFCVVRRTVHGAREETRVALIDNVQVEWIDHSRRSSAATRVNEPEAITTCKQQTGLAAEIREALTKAAAKGQSLTSAELDEQCPSSPGPSQISAALHYLHKQGDVAREIVPGTNKYAYTLAAKEPKPRASTMILAKPEASANVAPTAPTVTEALAVARVAASPEKFRYDLYDHIGAALKDVEDLTFDALDQGATTDVQKALLTAQASLRRAQESIVRQARQPA